LHTHWPRIHPGPEDMPARKKLPMEPPIASQVRLKAPFDQALEAVIAALKQEGFGMLIRMVVKQALKEKLARNSDFT
jgi:uncharacterized protein (DUF302 family)